MLESSLLYVCMRRDFEDALEQSYKLNQDTLEKGMPHVTSADLQRQVARINVTKADVISRLGMLSRDQAAWRHHRYDQLL